MKKLYWISVILILLFFHTRGIFYSDDGYILNSALRTLHGQIPYKDFHFAYTPLSIFVELLSFKIFGVSILSSRILAAIISLLTIFVLNKLSRTITHSLFSFIPGIIYLYWIPTHSNFIFPTPLAITTGLLTCLLILNKKYFWAGFFTVITFLLKQNFGAVLLLNSLLALFIPMLNKKEFIRQYLKGFTLVIILFLLYLLGTHSLPAFINDFNTYTFQRIVQEQQLSTSLFYGFSFASIAKLLFYLSPLIIGATSLYLCFKKNKKFIFLCTFVILYYLVGIRPTTDYIHLTPLLSLLGIPILILLNFQHKLKPLVILSSLIIIILGFYTGLFFNYYRWNPRLMDNNYFSKNPRIMIFTLDNKLEDMAKLIDSQTNSNDYIFVDSYNPIYYFVADRKNPTKFDLLEGGSFYHKFRSELVNNIRSKNTKLIIADPDKNAAFLGNDILEGYELKQNYCGLGVFDKINR